MPERDEVINPVLLAASDLGCRLSRNNSGLAFHKDGSVVRYGVFTPGGADTLGWSPVVIRPHHVGQTLAVFTAIECKTGRVPVTKDQERFLLNVNVAGGIGLSGNDPDRLIALLKERMLR